MRTEGNSPASDRPQVLAIGPLPPPLNGMTVMTAYVLTSLSAQGVQVVHFDASDHREVGNVGRLDSRNVWLAFRHGFELYQATERIRPKAVYLPIAQSTLGLLRDSLFFLAARRRRIPVVVHLHGAAFGEFYRRANPLVRAMTRFCLAGTRKVIVLGESLRGVFEGLVDPERVVVVPNGIPDLPPVAGGERQATGPHIVYISNLSIGKGYTDLVEAAYEVLKMHPSARFTLAGEWARFSESGPIVEGLARLGVADRVSIGASVVGLRKHELLRSADVFVFPPRQLEGQPVVLLEAMSHGLPVITTPRGGIPDTVVEGKTAVLVPPGDPKALAEAISSLIDDPVRRRTMGSAGRSLYEERFKADRFGAALAEAVS